MATRLNEVENKRSDMEKEFKYKKSQVRQAHSTHTGIKLSVAEELFIDEYIRNGGDAEKAYLVTGKVAKNVASAAKRMMKAHIKDEIAYRLDLAASKGVADKNEILQYLTSVMRGDSDDDDETAPSVSERIRAAQELAKHQIEAKEKLNTINRKIEMTIILDWERPEPSNLDKAYESLHSEDSIESNDNDNDNTEE